MSDNGKTKDEARKEKEKRFFENPDEFIDMKDIVVAVFKKEGKMTCLLSKASRVDLQRAQSEVNFRVFQTLTSMEIQQGLAQGHTNIVTPGQFRRGLKFFKKER